MSKLAIVFPGQSSQRVGMLSDLAMHYSLVEETFFEASEILGYDMWKLVQCGPEIELNKTYRAQPAILTASVAIWRIWKQYKGVGCVPEIMAGHSLGEYSALVCSDSISLSSAVRLVMIRGLLMQNLVPYGCGSMSVIIGLSKNIVCELCKKVTMDQKQVVSPAGFNAPKHVVISGYTESVKQVNLLCKKAGAKYIFILPISVPSHCELMKPMVKQFTQELEKIIIHIPTIPVINNVDVRIERDIKFIRNALIKQLYTPVRWQEIIQYCLNQKINRFLEMGPGQVLTGLVRRTTVSDVFSLSVNDSISLKKAVELVCSSSRNIEMEGNL